MKVMKLLGVTVMLVGMLTLLTATAYANHATIETALNCTSQTKVCFDLTVSTSQFPQQGRDITVTLLGHKKGDADAKHFVPVGSSQTVHLNDNLDAKKIQVCFNDVKTSDFDAFELNIKPDNAEDFDINGKTEVTFGPFANNCPTPTPSPSPSSSASASPIPSPSPSASANTVAVLANTGGFDFRFPLIGLVVLVAGAALFVVSASRGRSASNQ